MERFRTRCNDFGDLGGIYSDQNSLGAWYELWDYYFATQFGFSIRHAVNFQHLLSDHLQMFIDSLERKTPRHDLAFVHLLDKQMSPYLQKGLSILPNLLTNSWDISYDSAMELIDMYRLCLYCFDLIEIELGGNPLGATDFRKQYVNCMKYWGVYTEVISDENAGKRIEKEAQNAFGSFKDHVVASMKCENDLVETRDKEMNGHVVEETCGIMLIDDEIRDDDDHKILKKQRLKLLTNINEEINFTKDVEIHVLTDPKRMSGMRTCYRNFTEEENYSFTEQEEPMGDLIINMKIIEVPPTVGILQYKVWNPGIEFHGIVPFIWIKVKRVILTISYTSSMDIQVVQIWLAFFFVRIWDPGGC